MVAGLSAAYTAPPPTAGSMCQLLSPCQTIEEFCTSRREIYLDIFKARYFQSSDGSRAAAIGVGALNETVHEDDGSPKVR